MVLAAQPRAAIGKTVTIEVRDILCSPVSPATSSDETGAGSRGILLAILTNADLAIQLKRPRQ